MTRVAVCDDSRTYVHALRKVLEADGDIAVVGAYGRAEELLAALPSLKADLVTMDLELPGIDGIEATRRIMAACPMPVVVLSSHADERATEALAAGAVDVPHKGEVTSATSAALPGGVAPAHAPPQPAARQRAARAARGPAAPARPPAAAGHRRCPRRRAIGVAASTGGPSALRACWGRCPPSRRTGCSSSST